MRLHILFVAAIALCHAWSGLVNAGVTAFEMDFANTPGAYLNFSGHNGTFSFAPDSSGHDFEIINVSGGTGSALGLFGTVSGTFTIGSVANNEASVTGTGVLTIFDGSHDLTANLSFLSIDKAGWLGDLNDNEAVNLSNIHYTGTNQDLLTLANGGDPKAMLSFFDSQMLAQLASGGEAVHTGFFGVIDPTVPEPGTMTIFLASLPLIGGFRAARRRRQAAGASLS